MLSNSVLTCEQRKSWTNMIKLTGSFFVSFHCEHAKRGSDRQMIKNDTRFLISCPIQFHFI